MRITTVGGESSIGALADRLYANLTQESRRLAVAALQRANPHLAKPGGLTTGVVVRVPVEGGLTLKAAAQDDDPVEAVLETLGRAAVEYQKSLTESATAARKDLADQAALLKSREVTAALGKSPDAKKVATSLVASLAQRNKELVEADKRVNAAFTALAKDIAKLRDAAGG